MDIILSLYGFDPYRFIIKLFNLLLSLKHLIFLLSLPHHHDLPITTRRRTVFAFQPPLTTPPTSITSDNPYRKERASQK